MNIKWKIVVIGLVLALISQIILSMFFRSLGGFIGYFLATICVGYAVGEDYWTAAIHGAIVSIIISIFDGILLLIHTGILVGVEFTLFIVLFGIIIDGIIGALGGVTGFFIKQSRSSILR